MLIKFADVRGKIFFVNTSHIVAITENSCKPVNSWIFTVVGGEAEAGIAFHVPLTPDEVKAEIDEQSRAGGAR